MLAFYTGTVRATPDARVEMIFSFQYAVRLVGQQLAIRCALTKGFMISRSCESSHRVTITALRPNARAVRGCLLTTTRLVIGNYQVARTASSFFHSAATYGTSLSKMRSAMSCARGTAPSMHTHTES